MLNLNSLNKEQLRDALRGIARQCKDSIELQAKVDQELPGVAVAVIYCGPSFMGSAMSHYHPGVISF